MGTRTSCPDPNGRPARAAPAGEARSSLQAPIAATCRVHLHRRRRGAAGARERAVHRLAHRSQRARSRPGHALGGESRVDDWRFVPGTDNLLMLTFDGRAHARVSLGRGARRARQRGPDHGIAQGSTTSSWSESTGRSRSTSPPRRGGAAGDRQGLGQVNSDPLADGQTLRVLAQLDGFTVRSTPCTSSTSRARPQCSVEPKDTLIETCVSPSGLRRTFLVAPTRSTTLRRAPAAAAEAADHVVSLANGHEQVALRASISWCQTPPRL